jgi:two-component system chemotaxis sensor kinase CheA
MSIDMSQFYQVFFEETSEHLASMENLLLNLDVDNPSLEDLNAVFRAAHSIKGGSGTFGFTDMTTVTHVLEGLLDRLRKEELPLRAEMVDAFLAAGDVLRAQLEHHQGGPDADADEIETVCARLNQLAAGDVAGNAGQTEVEPAAKASEPAQVRTIRLACALPPNVIAVPESINNLLDALRDIAAVEIKHHPDNVDDQLVVVLTTQASDADLREALAFYSAPEAISIQTAVIEEAYGFFDDLPDTASAPATESAAYGFFDDIPSELAAPKVDEATEAETAYGFFVDLPNEAAAEIDAGYGLFDDAPGSPSDQPAHPLVSPGDSPAAIEGVGYGIYVNAPGGLGLFDDAPGAEHVLKNSAPPPFRDKGASPAVAAAVPVATSTPEGVGRRLADNPTIETAKSGRRDNDKTVTAANTDTSIRVAVEKVDQLINLVGELVITQAMLAEAAGNIDPVLAEKLLAGIDLLSRNTRDMQESVMSIRMLPMSMVFSRFPRVVRDLAGKLNKQVEMKTIGDNTELDKGLIEKITDPMTHLVRNSLDHGIETPEKRIAAGKNPKGTLTLKASHQGGNVVIEVIDDGGGLNRARILEKAKEKGLPVSDVMSDFDVWQLIFAPGFSTADVVTDVSGRGVGMDVVKRNIEGLGGRVELESSPGFGTRTVIRLPLTLAILDGMSVGVGGETFIVPITTVIESLQPNLDDIRTMAGDSRMVHIRGEYLPFISLAEAFGLDGVDDITKGLLVVVEAEEGKAALFVDELLGQQQVVIKSLEANYRKVPGISGATIMGDGRVAMIIDVTAVTRMGLANAKRRLVA